MRKRFAPPTPLHQSVDDGPVSAMMRANTFPEAPVLLAVARPVLDPAASESLHAALSQGVDWTLLVEQALAHGVGALLCRHLASAPPGIVPEDIRTTAAVYLQARKTATAVAIGELAGLIAALHQAGISALPFKGPTLSAQAYGDPAVRVSRDLYILVATQSIEPTTRVLQHLGYQSRNRDLSPRRLRDFYRYNGQDEWFAADRLLLEPHWELAPRTLSMALDTTGFWTRAGQIPLNGTMLPCLSAEDAVLVACLHGGKEQWVRLLWIADIAALLHRFPSLDWTAILQRADAVGCRRMVLLGIRLAAALLDAPLPAHISAVAMADPVAGRLAERVGRTLFATPVATPSVFRLSRFRWQMRERWSDRLRYLARTLLTARTGHFRSVDLPDGLAFLYPAVRLGHDGLALPLWKGLRRLRS